MNLEKRIKRHIIGREHEGFAVTLPEFERLCADEIDSLSDTARVTEVLKGGVSFCGRLTDIYRANLEVRTAGRILMRLDRFKASNFKQLASHIRKFPWELYLPPGALPAAKVTSHHSRLYHSGAVTERIENGIASRWSEQGLTTTRTEGQTLYVRLQDDGVILSLDSSGAPLHRRGLKAHAARAPLRETMAAVILRVAGYRPGAPLIDPMCGSGTFSLEAALMAKHIPPGFRRSFSFQQWPAFRPRQWAYLKKKAGENIQRSDAPTIWASDADEAACARLRKCIGRYQLEDAITVSNTNFFDLQPGKLTPTRQPGLVVLNPPYGQRLHTQGNTQRHYKEIVVKLKKAFKGWQVALLVPHSILAEKLDLSLQPLRMHHGGLKLTLLVGKL